MASKHHRLAMEMEEERRAKLDNDTICVYNYIVDILYDKV